MMKKITFMMLTILLLTTACSSDQDTKSGDAIIDIAELTGFEKNLIEMMNSQSFVYDIDIKNRDVKELRATVDYYENGELISSTPDFTASLSEIDFKDPIRTVFMRQHANEDNEQWISAIITDNGQASATTEPSGEKAEEMALSAWGGISNATPLLIGEKKIIAHIIQSNKDGVTSPNQIDTEEQFKMMTDYEQVYLISVELR